MPMADGQTSGSRRSTPGAVRRAFPRRYAKGGARRDRIHGECSCLACRASGMGRSHLGRQKCAHRISACGHETAFEHKRHGPNYVQSLSHRAMSVNPRFEMIEHPHHDDECVLFAGNRGRFVPGRPEHNITEPPFFELPASGSAPPPLFKGMAAYLYLTVFSKQPLWRRQLWQVCWIAGRVRPALTVYAVPQAHGSLYETSLTARFSTMTQHRRNDA